MSEVTREEQFLSAAATKDASKLPDPVTREEQFLYAAATGDTTTLPEPKTRRETYLQSIAESGGGGGQTITVSPLSVTANGTYSAPTGKAYSPVEVSVEGVDIDALSVSANGTYSAPSGTAYSPVEVNVPNSYGASDEGKVVSNGSLVPQTSSAVTANGVVDTTLINSVDVNVSGGGGSDAEDAIIMRTISGTYVNSRVTSIGNNVFSNCSSLTTVSFSVAISIGTYAFASCSRLTTASFPVAQNIGSSAFFNCSSLTTVSFPAVTQINQYAFSNCYNLTTVSFPVAQDIGNSAFYRCTRLVSLYLAGSSVATLSQSGAFTSTPIGGYSASAKQYGSIYVPSSLLTAYQSKTNWTYFSSRFVGI